MHVNTTPHPNLPPQGGKESSFQSQLAPLVTANDAERASASARSVSPPLITGSDATNGMQSLAPQKQSLPTRFSNAVAVIAGKAVTAPGAPAPAAKKLTPGLADSNQFF